VIIHRGYKVELDLCEAGTKQEVNVRQHLDFHKFWRTER
jgi:hypothetical protein